MTLKKIYKFIMSGLLEKYIDNVIKYPIEKIEVWRDGDLVAEAYYKYVFYLAYENLGCNIMCVIANKYIANDETLFYNDYFFKITDSDGKIYFIKNDTESKE